jgi:hypothetical protein
MNERLVTCVRSFACGCIRGSSWGKIEHQGTQRVQQTEQELDKTGDGLYKKEARRLCYLEPPRRRCAQRSTSITGSTRLLGGSARSEVIWQDVLHAIEPGEGRCSFAYSGQDAGRMHVQTA